MTVGHVLGRYVYPNKIYEKITFDWIYVIIVGNKNYMLNNVRDVQDDYKQFYGLI